MIAARLAGPADLALVTSITEQAYAAYLPLLGGPPLPLTEDYVPRIAAGEVWIVSLDGTASALSVIETEADHVLIFSLAVLPAAQGAGLGQWMLHHAEALARGGGRTCVKLYTNAKMERNIGIYRRFGFRETSRQPNPKRPGWIAVHMEKRLA